MSRNIRNRSVTDGGVVVQSAPTPTNATSQSGVSGAIGRTNTKRVIVDGVTMYEATDVYGDVHTHSSALELEAILVSSIDKKRKQEAEEEKKKAEEALQQAEEEERQADEDKRVADENAKKWAEWLAYRAQLEQQWADMDYGDRQGGIDYGDEFPIEIGPDPEDPEPSDEDKWNPFSKESLEGVHEMHMSLLTADNAESFSDVMRYYEGKTYDVGGVLAMPFLDKFVRKLTGSDKIARKFGKGRTKLFKRAAAAMIIADMSRAIRTGDPYEVLPRFETGSPFGIGESGEYVSMPYLDRLLRSVNVVGAISRGEPMKIRDLPGMGEVSQDGESEDFFPGMANAVGGILEGIKPGQVSVGGMLPFQAMTKFESHAKRVRSIRGIRVLESDRYYTVMYDPIAKITYVEWKPTEDIRNITSRDKMRSVGREWTEDAIAALGARIPAWSKRVDHIKRKYGMESDSVKHYGYSRGAGIATHMGGLGYGTGYFSSYMPSKHSKSKMSGDALHDYVINPLSYTLMLRNALRK
jgi:hypothetical protein